MPAARSAYTGRAWSNAPPVRLPEIDRCDGSGSCNAAARARLARAASLPAGGRPPILKTMRRVPIDPVFPDEPEPPARCCDHPGCAAGGNFRAPKSRLELNDYYWFCLEHVRGYNSAWNYYAGMNDREIEAEIRRDTVWQRPSWRLGARHGPAFAAQVRDPFGFYPGRAENGGTRRSRRRADPATERALSAREQALAVFAIEPPMTMVAVKARYHALVKQHHPDAHGGDKAAEEKLKIINQAYATLKASYFS
jgi:hypothetical protein